MLIVSHQRGFSLVELMVGIVVGFFVVLVASTVYLNVFNSSADSMRLAKLNQDMRSIMDIMTYDLHRAGFSAGGDDRFMKRSGQATDIQISSDGSCILYTFDLNRNGNLDIVDNYPDIVELFGFRYNPTNKRVETLAGLVTFPAAGTALVSDCLDSALAPYWKQLNFESDVVLSALTFSTEGSQCLFLKPASFNSSAPSNTPAITYAKWELTGGANSVAACDTTPSSGTAVVPSAGTGKFSFSTSPATVDTTLLTSFAEVRRVKITLTANHARDTALSRTLTEDVRIRNDRVK